MTAKLALDFFRNCEMRRVTAGLCLVTCLSSAHVLAQAKSSKSSTCNEVAGRTDKDLVNALKFCDAAIPKAISKEIQGVIVLESLIWVKVSRTLAESMRRDHTSARQLVRNWINAFRTVSGLKAVNVTAEWGNVEIAKGETSFFNGDLVTIK